MRFVRLGRFVVRARWWILGVAAVFFVAAGSYGLDVAGTLSSGGFSDPGSASAQASDYLADTLGNGTPDVVVLVTPKEGGTVDDPTIVAAGTALTEELAAQPAVDQAVSYWTLGNAPPLRSATGSSALMLAQTTGDEEEVRQEAADLSERFSSDGPIIVTRVGGVSEAFREVTTTVESDLRKAELLALPLTLIMLLLVFPVPFLRSFAYAGIGVVAMAVIAAVVVLSAMLAALGDRVDSLPPHRHRR